MIVSNCLIIVITRDCGNHNVGQLEVILAPPPYSQPRTSRECVILQYNNIYYIVSLEVEPQPFHHYLLVDLVEQTFCTLANVICSPRFNIFAWLRIFN